jgi:drug/metabolite transporter (DMT)-like permease
MLIGIGLALAATLGYTINSLFLTLLKEKAGVVSTKYLFLIALTMNLLIHFFIYKRLYPVDLQARQFLFLGASGIIGLLLGYIIMIKALQLIGPRLVLLIATSTTVFSFLLGWLVLGERQSLIGFVYIGMIIGGIIITVLNTDSSQVAAGGLNNKSPVIGPTHTGTLLKGVLLSVLLAFCQSVSQLLSKVVLLEGVPALSVSTVRLSIASGGLVIFTLLFNNAGKITAKTFSKLDWVYITAGALLGPVLAVFLNLYALRFITLGISASVFQLSPVFMLFIARIIFKDRINLYAFLGTCLAVGGTVFLALS